MSCVSLDSRSVTAAMMGHRKLSQPALNLVHALNTMPTDDPLAVAVAGWRKLAQHWGAAQMDDGSLAGRKGWPPIFNMPQILTLFASTALRDRSPATAIDPSSNSSLVAIQNRAERFLTNQSHDGNHQELVLRVVPTTQRDAQHTPSLLKNLRSLQRKDGGWSQTADRSSDAFATGQSLYVFHRAGVPLSDVTVRCGCSIS